MKQVLPTIFLIVGSIIGAGFASGREISLFFAEFGYASLYFIPIVFVLFYYCFKIFLTLGSKQNFENVLAINRKTSSSIFFDITIIALFFIYASAMFSCCVEVLTSAFLEIPTIIFYIFIFAIMFFVLKFGFKGLLKINFVLIPIIVVLILSYSIYSLLNPITTMPYIASNSGAYILPISIFMYVFANILLSYFVITEAGRGLKKKQIQKISFFASFIITLIISVCILCLVVNGNIVMDASMPFVLLTLRLGEPFPMLYTFVLFLGVLTSLFACLHTVKKCLQPKFKHRTDLLCCFIVVAFSILGFKTIVNSFYPIIGFFGVVMLIKILKTKKFNTYFEEIY